MPDGRFPARRWRVRQAGSGGFLGGAPQPPLPQRRNADGDDGALALGRPDLESAAMQFGERTGDRQSETRACMALRELVLDLLERPPELFQCLARNAAAIVLYGQRHHVAYLLGA